MTTCTNPRHKTSHQGWMKRPSRRRRVPRVGKQAKTPHSHCQKSHKNLKKKSSVLVLLTTSDTTFSELCCRSLGQVAKSNHRVTGFLSKQCSGSLPLPNSVSCSLQGATPSHSFSFPLLVFKGLFSLIQEDGCGKPVSDAVFIFH